MTPSPSSPARPSCGGTGRPASSSGTRARTRRGPRRLIRAGGIFRAFVNPKVRCLAASPDRQRLFDLSRRRKRRVIEVELTEINSPLLQHHPATEIFVSSSTACSAASTNGSARRRPRLLPRAAAGRRVRGPRDPLGTVKSRLHRALGSMRWGCPMMHPWRPSWTGKDSRHDHRRPPHDLPMILDELAVSPYPDTSTASSRPRRAGASGRSGRSPKGGFP